MSWTHGIVPAEVTVTNDIPKRYLKELSQTKDIPIVSHYVLACGYSSSSELLLIMAPPKKHALECQTPAHTGV